MEKKSGKIRKNNKPEEPKKLSKTGMALLKGISIGKIVDMEAVLK